MVEAEIATIMKPNDVIRTLFSKERLDRNGLKQLVPAFDWDDFFVQFGYPNVGGRPRMHRRAHAHKCTHTRTDVPADNCPFRPTDVGVRLRFGGPLVCAPKRSAAPYGCAAAHACAYPGPRESLAKCAVSYGGPQSVRCWLAAALGGARRGLGARRSGSTIRRSSLR